MYQYIGIHPESSLRLPGSSRWWGLGFQMFQPDSEMARAAGRTVPVTVARAAAQLRRRPLPGVLRL